MLNRTIRSGVVLSVCCLLLARAASAAEIGGKVYTGAATLNGGAATPILAPAPEVFPLTDAKVMVQNQHSGGTFIAYAAVGPTATCPACATNEWRATVPDDGDYVIMFSAADHNVTSREVTVDGAGGVLHPKQTASGIVMSTDPLAIDAYLPPLPLPLANLLVFTFYDNAINGEFDDEDDAPLNGVTVKAWDGQGNLLATGVTGTQPVTSMPAGENMEHADGFYYFTDLPPGAVTVTSDASTCYHYDANGDLAQLPTTNPVNGQPFDFDASTEFYLLSSEEGGRAFEVVLYPGDPGTEEEGFLVWHGFVEKLGQITAENVQERFGPRGSIIGAGKITGWLADADQNWEFEIPEPGDWEPPEALVQAQHPGVSANTLVPDGLVILHPDMETAMGRAVATAEPDPVTGQFEFLNVPPGRYRMFCCDVPIDYVYVQQEAYVSPGQHVLIPNPFLEPWLPGIMVPRFFARGQGFVKNNATGEPVPGAEVHVRLKDGSIWKTELTDAAGWYNFDDLPEVEVMAYVDVELPVGYRGAMVTDTFYPDAVWLDPWCNPIFPECVELGDPYTVTHNAMNRYIQWYTANYRADLFLEPIPAATGDVGGFVFYDRLAPGTWVGNGIYDESDDRTMHGVTVELWDATGTTLIATTTTGQVDKAAVLAQGWMQPYTFPLDEWGGVFVGPLPGFYEFRDLSPGDYKVKVIPPAGFAPSPTGSDMITVTVAGGARVDRDFGINTLVPLAGEIEGGVWDDVFVDPRPLSLMYLEKAGIDRAPVGVYDHLGYFLGASYQGNPMCYVGADVGPDPLTQCPPGDPIPQKPETERRFAPTPLLYLGNDPALPGYNDEYLPLMMPYTMGQGKFKFEADWSLVPVALGQGPTQMRFPPIPPPNPSPIIANVQPTAGFLITGQNFGSHRWFSTVTLSGKELFVTSWSDTEIHVQDPTDPITGPMIVTTLAGSSNAAHVEIAYDPARAAYMAARSVFVDVGNSGPEDGSNAQPWNTIGEALDNLPTATPRYVFVAAGYYNERVHIKESDIEIIGAGPRETTIDGLGSMQLSIEGQGFVGRGPVFFIGEGGEFGSVQNIMISGLTVTRGTVDDDIGCGIFGDYGNRNLDINTCILDHNGGYYGGAIWLHKSNHDVKIWSNTISNNGNPGGYSGGISVNDEPEYGPEHGQPEHIWDDHLPGCPPGTYEIFNNHILRNYSPDYGAAIALYEVKDHLIVAGNLIEGNHAEDHGGAMFFEDSGPIDVFGNIIRRNSCYDDGGAISFEDVGDDIASVRVFNNLIAENWADDHGENHARGAGLAFDDTFYAEVFNNTIAGNVVAGSRDPAGGGIDSERHGHEYNGSDPLGFDLPPGYSDVKIYNNIIWGNMRLNYDQVQHSDEEDLDWRFGTNYVWTPDNLHVDNPNLQGEWESHVNSESFTHVEFNIIDNGEYAGRLGNIGLDPLFVDPANLDWHLAAGSPAVNQAPAITGPERDLERAFRLIGDGMVDMGAYELGALPGNEGLVSPLKSPVAVCDPGGPYVIECDGQTTASVQLDGRASNDPDPGRTLAYAWSTDCPGGTFDDDAGPTPVLTFTSGTPCSLTCIVTLTVSNCSLDDWTATSSTTVTVQDTMPPVLSGVPSDVTVECDSVPAPASPTASDICDAAPQIAYSEIRSDGSCSEGYTLTRTWTATDQCGHVVSQIQTITVQDTTPPVPSVPADISVQCDEPTDPSHTGQATATDNCDAAPVASYTDVQDLTGCDATGTIVRTWTVTDACGNATVPADQIITLVDTTAPVLSVPAGITVECDESTDPSNTGQATATDNCDPAPVISYLDVVALTGCNGTGAITRTWTATDGCGNSTSLAQIITVADGNGPALTIPPDVTIECDDPTDASNTGQATATDNCDASPVVTFSDTVGSGVCAHEWIVTRTWSATDACGNATALDQVITVLDTTAPALTKPLDVTVECDEPTDPSNTGSASATDNCDAVPAVAFGDSVAAGACPEQAVITRTWTATDACNNSISSGQMITVVDTTDPVLVCPSNRTITLTDSSTDPADTGQATATDNCDAEPGITFSDVEAPPYAYCPTAWIIARTWTAIDHCGNEMSCDQLIDVTDPSTLPPGYCCNPNNGDLNLIDDSNECTNDLCDPATGQVQHPDNGLCGACCAPGKACIYVLSATCDRLGGGFLGEQTVCLGDGDGDGIDDQCDNCNGVTDAIFGSWICKPSGRSCETDDDCPRDERCEKACIGEIPTVSGWGLLIFALLLMTGGKVYFGRRTLLFPKAASG